MYCHCVTRRLCPAAFTEAVAGAVTLSVLSPAHLEDKGLKPDNNLDGLYDIDFLYRRALQHVSVVLVRPNLLRAVPV